MTAATDTTDGSLPLDLRGVTIRYDREPVVTDVSLSVSTGEIVCLIGPNGAGKSTLVRAAAALAAPLSGEVRLFGRPAAAWSARALARRIAISLQTQALTPLFTVEEIVAMGRAPYLGFLGNETSQDRKVVRESLERFELLDLRGRRLGDLSGGEMQRALLARAFAQEPELLIVDEPTASLDLHHQVALLRLVRSWAKRGGHTVLAVLHDMNLASLLADRLVLLNRGRIEAEGEPQAVLESAAFRNVYGESVIVRRLPGHPGAPVVLPNPAGIKE